MQKIATPKGETLVALPLEEWSALLDESEDSR
jgi:hypothetical protein